MTTAAPLDPRADPADLRWTYPRARAVSNYDGDTVLLVVDVGLEASRRVRVRLARIDTPELRQAGGAAAKARAAELLAVEPLVLTTIKDRTEKHGRYLAEVVNGAGVNVTDALIAEGFGRPYSGGRR